MNLQVLDELYALLSSDDSIADTAPDDEAETEPEEACCCLSSDATGRSGTKTLQFSGLFLGHPIMILVDSGSSASFISHQFTSQMSISTTHCQPVSVRVANG